MANPDNPDWRPPPGDPYDVDALTPPSQGGPPPPPAQPASDSNYDHDD